MNDTLTQLHKDLKLLKKIVIYFSILTIVCIIWHKDNMQNLISALMITGFLSWSEFLAGLIQLKQ
jgi:hypothetical protein